LLWVLECLDDIASDMSVFHRVDDITVLDGATLMRLAWRLPAYQGAMHIRVQQAQADEPDMGAPVAPPGPAASGGAEWNPGTKATLMADPALKGLFSFG
jgi:hypothetical protein